MKRTLLAASVLSVFFLYQPVLAVEAHDPAKSEAAPAEMQQDMTKMDTSLHTMQEMREIMNGMMTQQEMKAK